MDLSLTPDEEKELMEMFSFEAQEIHQQLNKQLTALESNPQDQKLIDDLFRITHTLKGSAMGMGFRAIGEIAHVMEDVFTEIKSGNLTIDKELFNGLFSACDKLNELIINIKEKKKVSHKGVKTKLEVILRNAGVSKHAQPTLDDSEKQHVEDDEEQFENETVSTELKNEQLENEPQKFIFLRWLDIILSLFKSKSDNSLETKVNSSNIETPTVSFEDLGLTVDSNGEEDFFFTNFTPTQDDNSSEIDSLDERNLEFAPRPTIATNDEQSAIEFFESIHNEPEDDIEPAENDLLKNLQDKASLTELVQVPIRKLDNLMNQVGQLIIERDRLMAENIKLGARNTKYAGLQRITSDLQYSVMDVRLVQIGVLFNKFHRIARDVATIEDKPVQLELKGLEVEIDRSILKIMSDSMIHLVRNSVGHGLESAEERKLANKSDCGTITLSAQNEKDYVIIEVSDDGKGINANAIRAKLIKNGIVPKSLINELTDEDVIQYIFEPGFSNSDTINEVSGRGVGMDVVKISTESIGGQVSIKTEVGIGTTVRLKLPSSMAVKGVLMFLMKDQEFAFPLSHTEAVISLEKQKIRKAGVGLISSYLKKTISIIFFEELIKMKDFSEIYDSNVFQNAFDKHSDDSKFDVIVISYAEKYIGVIVDKLLYQKEIIEKAIPRPLENTKLLSGTTILGNGNVCMVVDVAAITDLLFKSKFKVHDQLRAS